MQNATAISRAAEAAGVKIGLGSVDLVPVMAFLIIMVLQLLIESPWYRALEVSTAASALQAHRRGAAWFSAERQHRACAMLARQAELERSRQRVVELRRMIAAKNPSAALHNNRNTEVGDDEVAGKQGD